MVQNVNGFGVVINIKADKTFPVGMTISQFADDSDPITINDVKIADTAMGLNGDLLKWNRATPLPLVINVIPGSRDDINLQILADANRVAEGKNSADDVITATIVYPDGSVVAFQGGAITDSAFGNGIQSSGRQRTKSYGFMFANKA